MRLQTRIQFFTTVVLLILLLAANTSIYFIFKNNSVSSEQERLTDLSNNILKALTENEEVSLEDMLQAHLLSDGVTRIVKNNSISLVQVTTDHVYKKIPMNYYDQQIEKIVTFENSMFVLVSIPAINNDGEVINIQLIENIDLLYKNIQDLKWVLIMTTGAVSLILFLTSGFVSRFLLLPIQRLTLTMNTIEKNGSFERIAVEKESKDELNEMAMTFNRMIIKLEDSYLKQEQFVSDASHELKTPLTVIDSYIKMLKRWGKERPDVLEEAIQSIESESSRMKYLTEQLLQLAKWEESAEKEREVADLDVLIKATIQRLQPSFNHSIHYLNPAGSRYVRIHEQSITQVLVILLDNARKYSDDEITVELIELNGEVGVCVMDKGVGIPKEAQAYIFDRMYRVDKTRSRKTGGTGLGLSIAKRIVEQHDGEILLKSVEGAGSTFTFILPLLEV